MEYFSTKDTISAVIPVSLKRLCSSEALTAFKVRLIPECMCVDVLSSSLTDADVRADPQQVALLSHGNSSWNLLMMAVIQSLRRVDESFLYLWSQFLYALPQKQGYEFFIGQWSGDQLHFTSLINIQVKTDLNQKSISVPSHLSVGEQTLGENAPSQLILYHYPALKEDKGLVFMTAEMDPKFIVSGPPAAPQHVALAADSSATLPSSSFQTVHQAQCLANQVQLFYGSQRQETYRLVEAFNHHPAEFKHLLVIAELEQSGLGAAAIPGGL